VERDYSAFHVNILHGLEGITPEYEDAYTIPGYEHLPRSYTKVAMLSIFNAKSRGEAFGAVLNAILKSGESDRLPEEREV